MAGLQITTGFLSDAECEDLLATLAEHVEAHPPAVIDRPAPLRSLRYDVVDGDAVHEWLPAFVDLYERVQRHVRANGWPDVVPLQNRTVGVNVNITPAGGEYRWHYDRNEVTAILFLNRVTGGETECYPGHRLLLGRFKASRAQQWLDRLLQWRPVLRLFGRLQVVSPEPGKLVVMRANRCLHSVRPVEGDDRRVTVIMAFDEPGAEFRQEKALDAYLYAADADATAFDPAGDPNYQQR